LRHYPSLRPARLYKRKWFVFRQPNLGVTPEWPKPAAQAFCIGEGGIEQWHGFDAPIRNAQVAGLRINPAE